MPKVYLGEFQHSIDRQRRLSIPREWKSDCKDEEFFLLPGRDKVVQVMPYDYFMTSIYDKLKDTPSADSSRLLTQIGRHGHKCKRDMQGRINLSPKLLEHAGLSLPDQVELLGSLHYFEVRAVRDESTDVDEFLNMLEDIQKSKSSEV